MSLSDFKEEELQDWRDNDVTQAIVRQLRADQEAIALRLEVLGSSGEDSHKAAAVAGMASELRRIRKIIETTRGK